MGSSMLLCLLLLPAAIYGRQKEALLKMQEPNYDVLTEFGYDTLMIGRSMGVKQHMMPLADRQPRLNPLLLTKPVPGCGSIHPCYLRLGDDGVLAVYSGSGPADKDTGLLSFIASPNGQVEGNVNGVAAALSLQLDGNLVLSAVEASLPRVLWSAGTSLPSACSIESPCGKGAHVALLADGSLALFLGLTPAAEAYLEVGLPAVSRLESCLWGNDFAGAGADAPREAMAAAGGKCYAPPIMSLISFPSSGATFTLEAITAATNHSVYTASKAGCAGDFRGQNRDICGRDAWDEFGMCPLPMGVNFKQTLPPPGKGAVLKNHVIGNGEDALCAPSMFQKGMLISENGVPFEPYGFARLFRNPFDNIVGRMHHRVDDNKIMTEYSKDGFLAENALYPQHDIWTFLYWHLNANIALIDIGKPTVTFNLKKVDRDQASFVRQVLNLLGYSESDVTTANLERLFPGALSAEEEAVQRRFRFGDEDLPVHIDFYDAATVRYVAKVIDTVVEGSACLTQPYCIQPPTGFRGWGALLVDPKH